MGGLVQGVKYYTPQLCRTRVATLDQWPNTEGFMSLLFYLFVAGLKLTIQFSLILNFRSFPPPPLKDITYLTCVHCHTWFY